ncbi:uncharacterized protein LOC125374835 [Haliotis rufescens]|uniref:uncharacterized protein LOC125374835 n=1 Tax=Haliotis rufescens TaxID=6454 RepID=UPI00201F14A6|nr:uncharacterized protein LOC125374835 [Haliotis rufescens]
MNTIPFIRNNLTHAKRTAINSLKNNSEIMIKKVDKGSAVVNLNTTDYIQEATRQLTDTNFYLKIDQDPIMEFANEITQLLNKFFTKEEITYKIFNRLLRKHPKPGQFYLLPKIHKNLTPGKVPVRPIIRGNGTATELIRSFVDEHIKEFVKHYPSYIRDTTHFIQTVGTFNLPPNSDIILVTMDVTSRYTNIPNIEGLRSVAQAIRRFKPDWQCVNREERERSIDEDSQGTINSPGQGVVDNSLDIFEEKMDLILEQCPGTLGISDDTAVFGKTVEEHDQNLHQLMKVAARYGLIFNIEKCEIRKERIKFFGNYYNAQGVHPDPEKVQEIHNLPPPANTVELQRILGMIQYMSSFIPNMADFTEPLRMLTHKDSVWQWTESHQAAFDKLKTMICLDGTLKYFDPRKPTVVQVDASMKGPGAVIMQD